MSYLVSNIFTIKLKESGGDGHSIRDMGYASGSVGRGSGSSSAVLAVTVGVSAYQDICNGCVDA